MAMFNLILRADISITTIRDAGPASEAGKHRHQSLLKPRLGSLTRPSYFLLVHTIRRDPRFNYPGSMVGGVGSTLISR